jgi:predicted metal-dependent phosphoesterase TrpH
MHDLHTHSTASDGSYTPAELVRQAGLAGVTVLALTDHDSTRGIGEARLAAAETGLRLIPAVEVSTTWQGKSIHVVGLNVNPDCPVLQKGLDGLQATRLERARIMSNRLADYGVPGAYDAVMDMAGTGMMTRTHFARYLVRCGMAATVRDVFDRYLTPGKPGYVQTEWASLEAAVNWIETAGGIAVLAHPQRYRLTATWMRKLLDQFKQAGGLGIEVVSGTASQGDMQSSAHYAKRYDLLASAGSDFHGPEMLWPKLGRMPHLPEYLTPVWQAW